MHTLIEVPAPVASTANKKWWPDLFLKKGRKLQEITPIQCAAFRKSFNSTGKLLKQIPLHDINGERIGFIDYYGRSFLEDIGGNVEILLN
jgi:hypothetical protein